MHHSLFDSPSFLQKILKKKPYNRPLYTSDIVAEVGPWKKQFQTASKVAQAAYSNRKPKTYNIRQPELSPSTSTITTSSLLSDSAIIIPTPSCSTPSQHHYQHHQAPGAPAPAPGPPSRKRPLSSEILIKIMDQKLKQQQQPTMAPTMTKSTSASTINTFHQPRLTAKIQSTVRRNSHRHHPRTHPSTIKTEQPTHHQRKKSMETQPQPYVLTLNNDEQDRMVAQHYLLRTAFGSDFNAPLKSQLQKGIVVLDVGCGPGTWTMEMSTAFPKSTFIGIDQNAFYPKDIKPRNCHFRTCGSLVVTHIAQTINLPFPDNSIDYIYQRDMNWAFTGQTWQPLLLEYQRILKPGGWIECVEPDLETQNSLEQECMMNDKLINGLSIRQQDPYAVHRLPTMLAINGFKRVEDCSQTFPLGWGSSHSNNNSILEEDEDQGEEAAANDKPLPKVPQQDHCSEFARAMSSQYLFLLESLKPWLSHAMDLNHEKYDEYISGLPAEWKRAKTYINWHCIIAQKPYIL
ncbi:type 11 methyltransferase [Mucor ambiguus]|uniref:Type 11 methyltransferase n=1 Tax=Mucor ambiguus TaxID=91626 RepID=A0A0C9M099_9FUNG|nr:type 11 methyltransferase [Mucor ambiguus]